MAFKGTQTPRTILRFPTCKNAFGFAYLIACISTLSACTPGGVSLSANSVASPTPGASSFPGPKVVQVLFQAGSGGSFNTLATQGDVQGTAPAPGSGHPAVRLFNADGTLLASTSSTGVKTNWPAWLTYFEIGISGPINTSAPNPDCATFATTTEASATNCNLLGITAASTTPSPSPAQCGAPTGQYRISEADCSLPSTGGIAAASAGSGGPADGIYMRATFSRANLGTNENILAVLQYSVSSLNSAPANPTSCFVNGKFLPENCSDFVWRVYMKHTVSESLLPYLLLIPPTFSAVLASGLTLGQPSGAGITAKQFLLPIAADPTLSVLQISRTQSNFPTPNNLLTYCTASGALPGDSPLCAGVVLYSLTLYRM